MGDQLGMSFNRFHLEGEKVLDFRYGENPHQENAALYRTGDHPLAPHNFVQVEGAAPSSTNYKDLSRCLKTMVRIMSAASPSERSVAGIGAKHGNACGVGWQGGYGFAHSEPLRKMLAGDTRALFGGVVVCNFAIDAELAEIMRTHAMPEGQRQQFDTVAAVDFNDEAIEILARHKTGKCRLLKNPALMGASKGLDSTPQITQLFGGDVVVEDAPVVLFDWLDRKIDRYGRQLIGQQLVDVQLAWAIGSTSNSNTVTLVHDGMLIGNGVGQQDRVGAAELAIKRARDAGHGDLLAGAAAYSDSFFPFPDGPQALIDAGITAILTSSGSQNDPLTIEVCEKADVGLVMIPDKFIRGFAAHSG